VLVFHGKYVCKCFFVRNNSKYKQKAIAKYSLLLLSRQCSQLVFDGQLCLSLVFLFFLLFRQCFLHNKVKQPHNCQSLQLKQRPNVCLPLASLLGIPPRNSAAAPRLRAVSRRFASPVALRSAPPTAVKHRQRLDLWLTNTIWCTMKLRTCRFFNSSCRAFSSSSYGSHYSER
jgi:hypothetical protein